MVNDKARKKDRPAGRAARWAGLGAAVWLAGCVSRPPPPPPPAPAPVVAAPAPAPAPVPAPPPASPPPARALDPKAKLALEQALTCASVGRSFAAAEAELGKSGWRNGQGVTPVALPKPVTVFGLTVRTVAVSRDGGEHTYRSHLGESTPLQLIKAAGLKRSKDGRSYTRTTKLGVLSMDTVNKEVVLDCTVDTER